MSKQDTIERLLEDLDNAAGEIGQLADGIHAAYFADREPEVSTDTYTGNIVVDVSRRLHALMPHDMNGREIKSRSSLSFGGEAVFQVWKLKVVPIDIVGSVISTVPEEHATVVQPDSWERLQEDTKLAPRDYLDDHGIEANEYGRVSTMAADIVRRAKALAGVE